MTEPRSSIVIDQNKPSIAVLPFINMSGDSDQDYFADGITDNLITDLSKVSGLSVVGRNSVFAYRGKAVDAKEVGRRFDVKTLLEGSVRKAGTSIRVNAQLVSTADGRHVWADRYDRTLSDIFAIQDEITHAIIEQLKVKLLPREQSAIDAAPTTSIEAYNYYLQGRHFYYFHTTPHTLLAQRMFKKATELDPGYARAYAGLADCASFLYINQHPAVSPEEILITSSRALDIDPDLAEAHAARGFALHNVGRYNEAVMEFENALALNGNLFEAHYFYGWAAKNAGDWETAARMFGRAGELAPNDCRSPLLLGQALEDLGREDEAKKATLVGIERAERALVSHPDIPLPAHLGAGALASLGERERALEWSSRALTIAPDDPLTLYNIACTYSQLGELDLAMDLVERWYEHANPTTRRWIVNDSDLDNLRQCQRFHDLLKQLE